MVLDNSILVLDGAQLEVNKLVAAGAARGASACSRRGRQALADGTHDVAFPILVHDPHHDHPVPLVRLLSGRLSLYYVPLAVAIATAMGASVLVALAWTPVAWRRSGSARETPASVAVPPEADRASATAAGHPDRVERAVGWTLRRWPFILALAVLSMAGAAWIYAARSIAAASGACRKRRCSIWGCRLPKGRTW